LCPVSVPSDGQTVPKELHAAKNDNPAAIERNFLIFGPFFCWAFFDFLLTAHLLANLLAEAPLPGREEGCHYDSSVLAVFILLGGGLDALGQYVKGKT